MNIFYDDHEYLQHEYPSNPASGWSKREREREGSIAELHIYILLLKLCAVLDDIFNSKSVWLE